MFNDKMLVILTLVEKNNKKMKFHEETFETNNQNDFLNDIEKRQINDILLLNEVWIEDIEQCYKTIYIKNDNDNTYREEKKHIIDLKQYV